MLFSSNLITKNLISKKKDRIIKEILTIKLPFPSEINKCLVNFNELKKKTKERIVVIIKLFVKKNEKIAKNKKAIKLVIKFKKKVFEIIFSEPYFSIKRVVIFGFEIFEKSKREKTRFIIKNNSPYFSGPNLLAI